MSLQRNSQRRRRVALEQSQLESTERAAPKAVSPKAKKQISTKVMTLYSDGAKRCRQPKTTDLIAKRTWSVIALAAILLSCIAALNLLHLNAPKWISVIGAEGVAALSLESGRGIALWYANFLLLLTSFASLQVFLLRQHRRDDYRGSYRIWLWLSGLFCLCSISCVTGVSQLITNTISSSISSTGVSGNINWIIFAKLVGILLLTARCAVEIRFSRVAVIGLSVVLLAYGFATLIEIPEVHAQSSEYVHAARGNLLLFGATALFLTVILFARHVYLEANGLLQLKQSKTKRKKKSTAKEAGKLKDDSKPAKKSPAKSPDDESVPKTTATKKRSKPKPSIAAVVKKEKSCKKSVEQPYLTESKTKKTSSKPAPSSDERLLSLDGDEDLTALSKSERRRLRKLKRRQQNRAA